MYCSKCGNTISDKLNYCNNCGSQLTIQKTDGNNVVLIGLIVSLALISMIGLGGAIWLIESLANKSMWAMQIFFIIGIYLLTLFGITFTIGKQISKIIDSKLGKNTKNAETILQPQLAAPITGQLEEARIKPMSVTEHTTKTLDEVLLKR
jgi:uncharacterized protein (DUF983 family)